MISSPEDAKAAVVSVFLHPSCTIMPYHVSRTPMMSAILKRNCSFQINSLIQSHPMTL